MLNDIEATAIENLDEKYAGIIAKKVGGIIAKEVVSDQIGKLTNSPELGLLSKVAFYFSDQADLRSWSLLPRDLQLLRIPLAAGNYMVRLSPIGAESKSKEVQFELKAGSRKFIHHRYMP